MRLVRIDTKTGKVTDFQSGKKVPNKLLSNRTRRMSDCVKKLNKNSVKLDDMPREKSTRQMLLEMFRTTENNRKAFPLQGVALDVFQIAGVQPRTKKGQEMMRGLLCYQTVCRRIGKWKPVKKITQYSISLLTDVLEIAQSMEQNVEIKYIQGCPLKIDTKHLRFWIAPRYPYDWVHKSKVQNRWVESDR